MRAWELRRIRDPLDPDLQALASLLEAVFADPDVVLGLDRLQEFVSQTPHERVFNALVARDAGVVVGCSVFSYVPASNCGFSEYIVVSRDARGTGLGRALFDARRELLDQQAAATVGSRCNGLFIEADSPLRVPPELAERERETGIDTWERLRIFDHLGFKRVDVEYVQPPLGPGKTAVTYLDLLFAPWTNELESVQSAWVIDTLGPIWRNWSAATCAAALNALHARLRRPTLALSRLV